MKITHLTSVHPRYDTRIFQKECCSLSNAGHQVSLVVADGRDDEFKEGVRIFNIGAYESRAGRMFKITKRVFEKVKALDADIYHLHDPELISVGLKLKRLGKKVIFDAHEDVPNQLLSKHYLNKHAKWFLSKIFATYEKWACRRFDAIVTATPFIRNKFLAINPHSVDINNFPVLDEFASAANGWSAKSNQICYIGAVGAIRGINEIVQAMELVASGVRLQLGGKFRELDVEREVKSYAGWSAVNELGWLDRKGVRDVLAGSVAGLVILHPIINYLDSLPVKMFEYMAAGIPVIASNFPLWREIIEGNQCGICVDPLNPQKIARAVNKMLADHKLAATMGANGRKAIEQDYNWHNEEKKLLDLYQKLL